MEHIKRASSHLRGTIRQELDRPSTHFSEEDYQLLKFHGTYQQHDRDTATRDLAGKCANGTLRITSRQGIQLHGVLKGNLERTIAEINLADNARRLR